jgi:hypothetical protein
VRKIHVLLALGLLALAASCETLNVGGGGPVTGPVFTSFTISPSSGLFAGDTVTATATFEDPGTGPYTVTFDMGGGTTPNTGTITNATNPVSQQFVLSNNAGGTFTATVRITDSNGAFDERTITYTYGPVQNARPSITSVTVDNDACTFTVTTTDPEGDDVTLTTSGITGGTLNAATGTVTGGNGTFTFTAAPTDFLLGGTVAGTVVASDAGGDSTGAASTFSVVCAGITLAPDTLYAIPLSSTAAAGEAVTIVVASGVPANPFQFMNGVRVTAPAGFEYVSDSFNVGVPGGEADDADGIWAAMNPSGFLLPNDNFIVETAGLAADATGVAGRTGIDFNVTPLGGSDLTTASGALFNFQGTFAAGTNLLSFQETQGVSRTYYTDSNAAPEFFWGDIDNNNGEPNTVTVN